MSYWTEQAFEEGQVVQYLKYLDKDNKDEETGLKESMYSSNSTLSQNLG